MKNQLKKSFSLFLAVLMILSCWVWVAPDKAEAAAPNSYQLEMNFTVSDACNGGTVKADVTHVANNGTGSATTTTWNLDKCESDTGTYSLTKDFSGFPTKIVWSVSQGGARTQEIKLNYFKINGTTILQGGWTLKPGWWSSGSKTMEKSGEVVGGDQGSPSVNSWPTPKLDSAVATLNPASHTLGKLGTTNNSTSTISLSGHKDQYGVNWTGTLNNTFTLRVDDGITLGSNATMSGSGNSRTITINPRFQTLYPGKQNAKLYIDWTTAGGSGKKTGTETITVDFPVYDITFDANGGKIGADDSESKDKIVYNSASGYELNYGETIGKAPAYATKDGFTFKGFYATKNADATGLTASFSGTKFVDAGTDNATTVPTQGDTTWYAAWQATPISATFVTADNQLIGTVEGRYNNNMTASNMYNGDAGLNAAVKAAYTGSTVKFNGNNEPIYTDGSTTYKFAGWKIIKAYDESVVDGNEDTVLKGDVTFQAVYTKADAKTYTVSFEDGNGNVVSTKSDYKYRDDVTNVPATDPTKAQDDRYKYEFIGWAKDIGKNFYAVDEYDNDENGARIVYTHKDAASFVVKGDASYVPVFRMVPREYSVTFEYTVDGGATESITVDGYHWLDGVTMPEGIKNNYTQGGYRYYIDGWKVGTEATKKQLGEISVNGNLVLTATYGAGEAAKYTINFFDKDGKLLNADNNIFTHNSAVTAPAIDNTINTEDSLYTFVAFKDKNGNVYSTTATGDADYYAEYTRKDYADIHFYNYDGTLIYETIGNENSLFVGETIPAFVGEEPTKAEDAVGTYNFTGWKDGNGNDVVPGEATFTGDTYLYAQFETIYNDYTVKFMNGETEVSSATYHYGDEITVPADPSKAADVEYIYDFRAWSPEVSKVCYGNATYTATYRRTPQYYKVTWLNDKKAVHTESNYTYNAKIQQAVINAPVGYGAAATGKTWAFKHWVQCDANGNDILVDGKQVLFVRGQRMGSEQLYFYPVFEQVDNVLTVTFYKEDGTTLLGEAKIPYGKALADYAEPFAEKAPKASDANYHYIIENWVNVDGGAAVPTVTADVSVKATYTSEEHNKKLYEIVAEPTCNVPGYGHYKCEADECTAIDYNVAIAPIADKGAPTGQIYVGTEKWTLDGLASIDYNKVTFVNPNTQLIVNAEDTGSVSSPWNEDGKKSRGVGKIEYYVADKELQDTSAITKWTTIYNYEEFRTEALNAVLAENKITLVDYNGYIRGTVEQQMKKAEIDRTVDTLLSIYNANATGVVSNLNLENGKTYVIYIKVSDREGLGEVNSCIFSSGTISYGSTAPTVAVSGEGYGTKFCADATVSVTDDTDGFKVYLDGEEVTLTEGKFTCEEAGLHTVTVVDKNGNKTTKAFEIKGNHTYRNYTTAATCENAGSRYDLCTLCGHKANETVLPALGHSYTANFVDKAATCVVDGYRTYVCDNNCGTKLVLKPTDDATTLAQAKKYVEPAEGETEGTWVTLTADDLQHLKATGEHTYAKVKDEDGKDTAEDAWVIDKAATCKVVGSKHKDCTICGVIGRVTEEIPVDTVNGHKFYREKVTLEPTCTEKGEKTKTCRYCDTTVHVADIEALGHTAGEYKVLTEATCEGKGSKILTCSVCNVEIGEPIKDEDGNITGFNGNAVEIDALGHAWKLEGKPYKGEKVDENGNVVPDEDGNATMVWYQKYVCGNDSSHTKVEETDYEEPVAATVTFDFNGGSFTVPAVGNPNEFGYVPEMIKGTQTISTFVGESIGADEVETAFKQDNATKTYSFAYWATKNADGTYTEVKFPIEVKGDATYYAVYSEKFVNYTITYYKEDGTTEFKKTGYLHNGDEVTLAAGPAKAETNLVKYVFAGWQETTGDKVYTDKVTIDGANINLKARYTEVKKQYAVTYAYSSSNIIHTYTVTAGESAPDARTDFDVKKTYDTKYHYEFKAWNRANQLAQVESNIYTTPDFTAIEHVFVTSEKSAAKCGVNQVVTKTCECGYSYDAEVPNTALEHLWGDPVYDETTGKNTVTCTREGCSESDIDTRSFTAKFFKEAEDAQAIHGVYYIGWGSTIPATKLPAAPSKESTSSADYKFEGWYVKGDSEQKVVDFTTLKIEADYEFVAKFTEITRIYSVVFAYDGENTIEKHIDVPAGSSVTYGGVAPTKEPDENYHYTFSNWKGYTAADGYEITVANVQENVYIYAEFSKEKHEYDNVSELGEATCTNGKGTRYSCDCGKYYDVTGKPLEHEWEVVERKEATPNADGYIKSMCKNCTETKTETIKYVDNNMEIKVFVEINGVLQSGIKVEIQDKDGNPRTATTNANGIALFTVDKDGEYTCYVEKDGKKHQVALEAVKDGLEGYYKHTESANCTCACHRNNLWGTIFRFFHKIIKFVTGEFKCCNNPDPMYG